MLFLGALEPTLPVQRRQDRQGQLQKLRQKLGYLIIGLLQKQEDSNVVLKLNI